METSPPRFVADVHLGKLARHLRLLGFDTLYQNDYTKTDLLDLATKENRILLSRAGGLTRDPSVFFLCIQDEDPLVQLRQVVNELQLQKFMHPFSRCLACNGKLLVQEKQNVAHLLGENTRNYFDEFWQCSKCHRVYWKGSHYERMLDLVRMIEENNKDGI
jgi:uncharacterized protein with PIN domain